MPTTIRKGTKPSSDSDVRPLTASDTQTATDATGGTHRSTASHQSTFDGYQFIVSVVIDPSVVATRRCSERRGLSPPLPGGVKLLRSLHQCDRHLWYFARARVRFGPLPRTRPADGP